MMQTVFTTLSWKKEKLEMLCPKFILIHFLSGLLILCSSACVQAGSVTIDFASSTLVDQSYSADAFIDYKFDDEVLTALAHGIPLQIDIFLRIKRSRNWLWDPVVRDETISYKLQRLALSDHYLLTNLNGENKEQFQYLDEALRTLGTISKHFLFDHSTIQSESSYIGFIKSELNIEALPPPLRPMAYFSPQWQVESKWYEWLVK
jgi:hypothetical protein